MGLVTTIKGTLDGIEVIVDTLTVNNNVQKITVPVKDETWCYYTPKTGKKITWKNISRYKQKVTVTVKPQQNYCSCCGCSQYEDDFEPYEVEVDKYICPDTGEEILPGFIMGSYQVPIMKEFDIELTCYAEADWLEKKQWHLVVEKLGFDGQIVITSCETMVQDNDMPAVTKLIAVAEVPGGGS